MTENNLSPNPLVSIGLPVRNGGIFLVEALEQLIGQSYRNIEIIISDNNSSDNTEEICQAYAAKDSRISYTRHDSTLDASENFRHVLEHAHSDYFMWAAHDDRYSLNYIETLLSALMRDQNAVLAFSDVVIFHDFDTWRSANSIPYDFVCDGRRRFWRGLINREYIRDGYLHIYGLFNRKALNGYPWPVIELGGDRPLLLYLWRRGKFVRADGACFYCYKPEKKKSREQRARAVSGTDVRSYPYTRLSWACAHSAYEAEKREGRWRSLHLIFMVLLAKEIWKKAYGGVRKFGGRLLNVILRSTGMRIPRKRKTVAYITLNGRIPSTSANSVGVMQMCGQFSQQGLDTILIVPGQQGMPLAQLTTARDVFEYYSVAAPFEFKRFPNALSISSHLASLYSLALVLYALVRGVSLISTRSLEVAVWAAHLGIPVILESHNFSKFERHHMIGSWVTITRQTGKSVSMVVTTNAGRTSYINIGVPSERIRVLPNGVNVERFKPDASHDTLRNELGLQTNVPLVVFSGSLHEGRGGEEMLDCAALLPDVHILIVGGSPVDVTRYRALIEQRKLGNVSLIGHVSQSELPKYLMAADILLMPYTTRFSAHSFEYTSPMKMFEYMATGNPVVATDFPILHEVLVHEHNAIFVAPDSGAELARGVRFLLENPDISRKIGDNARADSQKYDWKYRASVIIEWQRSLGHLI